MSILIFFLTGAFGALVKDLIEDNTLELPKKIDGRFSLGFLGGMVTGGTVGVLIDQNPATSFAYGFMGTSIIENLIVPKVLGVKLEQTTEEIIKWIAKEESVDPDLALRVAKCENPKLDPKAIKINTDGSKDRGLFQINNKWHPEVSDEKAFDPIFSTRFFCKAFKEGHLDWWSATKKCWEK